MTEGSTGDGSTLRATLQIVASAACFSAIAIFTVIATQRGGAPLPAVLAWRYIISAASLVLVARGASGIATKRRNALAIAGLGGLGQAAVAFTALSALRWIPAATVGFLFYTFPAWVAVIAAARRIEPLDGRRILALALALGGIVALVGAPGNGALHPTGVALALGSALLYAIYIPVIGGLQRGASPAAASFWIAIGAGAAFVIGGAAAGEFTATLTPTAWGAVAGLALISTTLGFVLFLHGLPVLGPVRTAIISTVEPFWTAVLGALVLGQPLTAATAIGGALVAGAVVILQAGGRRKSG
jgi:drug/metabolite transporter (DMT)-like permease